MAALEYYGTGRRKSAAARVFADSGIWRRPLTGTVDFGDGHTVPATPGQPLTHRYAADGEYTITVTGSTSDGRSGTGTTKGKGTAGVMKRHGFHGVSSSHGSHRNHRKPGSIGACATPGRVFKGLRMAGRMGVERVTVQNLTVHAVDPERGLILIKGAIPGVKGGLVVLRSAVKKGDAV